MPERSAGGKMESMIAVAAAHSQGGRWEWDDATDPSSFCVAGQATNCNVCVGMIGKKVRQALHRAFLVSCPTSHIRTMPGAGFVKRVVFPPRNCLRGVNFSLGTGHPICLIENGGIGGGGAAARFGGLRQIHL